MTDPNTEPTREFPELSFTQEDIVHVDGFTSELHRQLDLATSVSREGEDFDRAYLLTVERYAKSEGEYIYAAGASDAVKLIIMAEGFGASRQDFYLRGYHAELAASRFLAPADIGTLTSLADMSYRYRQQGASEHNIMTAVTSSLAHELHATEQDNPTTVSVRKLALLAYGTGATLQSPALGYAGFLHEALENRRAQDGI